MFLALIKNSNTYSILGRGLSTNVIIVFSIVVAIFLRSAWYFYAEPFPTGSDSVIYYGLAKNILNYGVYALGSDGMVPHAYFLPVYPAFLALFMSFDQSFLAAALANLIASIGLIPVMFLLVNRLFRNEKLALIVAWICALQPSFIVYGTAVQSENLFSTLFFGGFYVLIMRQQITLTRVLISSLLLGSACLVRGEGLFYLPPIFIAAFFLSGAADFKSLIKQCWPLLLMPVLIILILGVWVLRNYHQVGAPTLSTTSGLNFYLAHNEIGYGWQEYTDLVAFLENATDDQGQPIHYGTPESSKYFMAQGLNHLKENPTAIVEDIALGTLHLYRPTTSVRNSREFPVVATIKFAAWVGVLLCALASVFFLRYLPWSGSLTLLAIAGMNWFCYAVLFWGAPRYRFAVEVIVIIFASIALLHIYYKFIKKSNEYYYRSNGMVRLSKETAS